ncbi:MAG: HD domain-containing protein [candidate division WS1 bacterium]|jgi:3'-5' exoribonuclease|nr:HD domain-containing protein [candidate division WS1 bacterium]
MDKQTVTQLRTSDRVEAPFLVSRKALVSFRNKPGNYLAVTLSDPTGSVPGRLWDNAEQVADQFDVGDVVMVFGRVDEYMGTLQVIIEGVRPCHPGEFSAADFLPSSKRDIGEMRQQLTDLVQRVRQPYLRTVLEHFFSDPQLLDEFAHAPGAKALHHSHIGGLLEHTVAVAHILLTVCQCHPELDEDLLITAALLHDIGKLRELSAHTSIEYTDTGRLIGHIVHTDRMVTAAIAQIDGFDDELADRLCHVLLSHHGQKEYGAPIVPMTAEACALHYADNLDAHVQYFRQVIEHGTSSGNRWSEYQRLFDRYIYLGAAHGQQEQ